MSELNEIRETILEQIRPSPFEVEESYIIFNQIRQAIALVAEKKRIEIAFIELEGSSGQKQTQLRNWRELDVFIGLPPSIIKGVDEEKPEKSFLRKLFTKLVTQVGVAAAKHVGCPAPQIAYAEHPYVSMSLGNYSADIVFCFDLSPEYILEKGPITAVDRTPHHSRFVNEHLSKVQRDDVRLLKAFLHSAFVYGDASPVGRTGFTGFSTEMIIYHKRNFDSAVEYLAKPSITPLDIFERTPQRLKSTFPNDLLIITDPTDPQRNIASSISERAYKYAQYNARQLLEKPSKSFFSMEPIPVFALDELKQLSPNYFVIEYHDDTGWHYTKTRDKLYRYFTKLQNFLSREPTGEPRFGTVFFEEVFEKPIFTIALYVEKDKISKKFKRIGPTLDFTEGVMQFKKKHPDAYLHNGRYQVDFSRPFTDAKQTLQHFLDNNKISPKLYLINITRNGSTRIGKQALWVLVKAVQPFIGTSSNQSKQRL